MADSLQDILRQQRVSQANLQGSQGITTRDAEGNLTNTQSNTGAPGVQQLAGAAGLPAAPTSPLSTALIGGNANQQKMAGTAQQKQAAITQATTPDQSLQSTLRTQQVRNQATGAEQGEMQKSKDMQDLGGLGDRVTDFINAQRQKLETSAQQATAGTGGVDVQAAAAYSGGATGTTQDLSPLKDTLKQLRADPTNMDLQLQVNKALGYDINTQLSPDQINSLYEDSISSISRGGAQVVDDKLSVDDLVNLPNFGYNTDQLSTLLGVPSAQLSGMSVGQLRDAITAEQQKEMSKTSGLEQKASSNLLGGAERAEARGAAQEASQTGLRASEADVQKLVGSIQNADQVSFGGQQYKVDDLLKDSTISGIITNYLNAAPGSPQRTQLEQSEPGLIDFINDNQKVLQDAATKLSGGAQQFSDIQTANKGVGTIGGQQVNTDLLKAIIPNYGQLASSKIDTTQIPLLNALNQTTNPTQAVNTLNAGIDADKSVIDQVQQLNPQQINNLLVANGGQNMANYVASITDYNNNQSRDKGNVGTNAQIVFGSVLNDPNKLIDQVKEATTYSSLGLPTDATLSKMSQGNIKDSDSLNSYLNSYIDQGGKPNLANAANGQDQSLQKLTLPAGDPKLSPADQDVYNKVIQTFGWGSSGPRDISQLINSAGLSMSQVQQLMQRNASIIPANGQQQFADIQKGLAQKGLQDFSQTSSIPPITTTMLAGGQIGSDAYNNAQAELNQYNQLIAKYQGMKNDPNAVTNYGSNVDDVINRLSKEVQPLQDALKNKFYSTYTPIAQQRQR